MKKYVITSNTLRVLLLFGLSCGAPITASSSRAPSLWNRLSQTRINPQSARQYLRQLWHGTQEVSAAELAQATELARLQKLEDIVAAQQAAAQATPWSRAQQYARRFLHGEQGTQTPEAIELVRLKNLQKSAEMTRYGQPRSALHQANYPVEAPPETMWALAKANPTGAALFALGVGATAAGAAAMSAKIYNEANNIAELATDLSSGFANIKEFEHELITDQLTDAIVRIYSTKEAAIPQRGFWPSTGMGTALIIDSEVDPRIHFVLTAAHCVQDQEQHFIRMQHAGLDTNVPVEPLIVDHEKDVAILWIKPQDSVDFTLKTGNLVPSVPLSYFPATEVKTNEAAMSLGYPWYILPNVRKLDKKLMFSLGPNSPHPEDIPGEYFMPESILFSQVGASGGPIITIRDKQPQVVGVLSGGGEIPWRSRAARFALDQPAYSKYIHAAGVGGLPHYIQEAQEKVAKSAK